MKQPRHGRTKAIGCIVSFSILVVMPIRCGIFAFLWGAVCDFLFIPDAFSILVAVPFALVVSIYCAPVAHLCYSLNFSTEAFGRLLHNITGRQYPSDFQAWFAVTLFYYIIAMGVAICVNALLARRQK